jgi:signal transduction histidine kinase
LKPQDIPLLNLNPELFGWALENMVRNALQSIDSKKGLIMIETGMDEINSMVRINITDNGKGMSASAARKIFNAGFTTKKRGWGLGLTLVKRIIEEYHRGFIFLKKTKPGETVFEILLPVKEVE